MEYGATMSLTALRAQRSLNKFADNISQTELPQMQMPQMPQNLSENASKGWTSLKKAVWDASPSTEYSQQQQQQSEIPRVPSAAAGRRKSIAQTSTATGLWSTVYSAVATSTTGLNRRLNGDALNESDEEGFKGESHLTRIMKEYYVSKAESARDLPSFLFTAEERSTSMGQPHSAPRQQQHQQQMLPHAPQSYSRSGGNNPPPASSSSSNSFADIFDSAEAAAASKSAARQKSVDSGYSSYSNTSNASNSRATDRLRQFREQRRPSVETIPEPNKLSSRPTGPQRALSSRSN